MPENEPKTVHEIADATGLPAQWIRAQARAGLLPYLPVGGSKMLFNLAAVRAALAERAKQFQPPKPPRRRAQHAPA